MSAIAGIVHFNKEPVPVEQGATMMDVLQKYPADDVQTWRNDHGTVFFGCHAQWITPESIDEPLPYYDAERQLAITADAIIDNRDELFGALQVDYGSRKGMPDSQLILLAYAKWGEDTPKHLIGDFAFMIWDEREQKLFGARDFSGTRTLYYTWKNQQFAFSTVMHPLLALPHIDRTLNEQWIAEFLAIPFTVDAVDVHSTVYKQINQIPPAHSVTIRRNGVSFQRYCILRAEKLLRLKSNEEYEEALREVLGRAVKDRLRTHRNVGSHLSGGLDSGSVASFAARSLQEQDKVLHTFSYVPVDDFVDWTHKSRVADERGYIRAAADYIGNIEVNFLNFEGKSAYSEIDDWLDALEMPYKFYENSFWVKGMYEEAAKKNVGVMLGGQRGNWTISWGYALDYQALLLRKLRWHRLYKEMMGFMSKYSTGRASVLKAVMKRAFPELVNLVLPKNGDYKPKLIHPDFASKTNALHRIAREGINITGKQQTVYEVKKNQFERLYFWNMNGSISTKLSLKHKVWGRDPTNDLRVVRFCLAVPEEQYVQEGVPRSLIRRSMQGYLPDEIRMNLKFRGIQGADGVHRMNSVWNQFVAETEKILQDPVTSQFLNLSEIKLALSKIRNEPKPECVYDKEFRMVIRCLIFGRFMKKFT